MRKIIAAFAAIFVALGVWSAPASAGNGYSDFYLTGNCSVNTGDGGWAELAATNYDSGVNQTYHVATKAGIVWAGGTNTVVSRTRVTGVYLNGVYKGNGRDFYISATGHGRNTLMIGAYTDKVTGSDGPTRFCSFRI